MHIGCKYIFILYKTQINNNIFFNSSKANVYPNTVLSHFLDEQSNHPFYGH